MIVAVISDTHLRTPSPWLKTIYDRHLAQADVLLHCGDSTGEAVWAFLNQHPAFHAVAGNTDEWSLSGQLPNTLDLNLAGFRVGVAHGWGDRPGTPLRVAEAFGPDFDLVCHGHTHKAHFSVIDGVQLLNPGALQADALPTIALVDLTPGQPISCSFVDV